ITGIEGLNSQNVFGFVNHEYLTANIWFHRLSLACAAGEDGKEITRRMIGFVKGLNQNCLHEEMEGGTEEGNKEAVERERRKFGFFVGLLASHPDAGWLLNLRDKPSWDTFWRETVSLPPTEPLIAENPEDPRTLLRELPWKIEDGDSVTQKEALAGTNGDEYSFGLRYELGTNPNAEKRLGIRKLEGDWPYGFPGFIAYEGNPEAAKRIVTCRTSTLQHGFNFALTPQETEEMLGRLLMTFRAEPGERDFRDTRRFGDLAVPYELEAICMRMREAAEIDARLNDQPSPTLPQEIWTILALGTRGSYPGEWDLILKEKGC
ncbi:MAG: hypothetical protein Q8N98_00390, partial [bacterium]|nr:hypothetical protein [bacterium]